VSRYIAAYDVTHSSQRTKVARVLGEYGRRLQFSVFEIDVEPEELPMLRRRVGALLARTDRFDLVPIDLDDRRIRLAWQRVPPPHAAVQFA
jgi:CRISPR-associated protein Cas2